MRVVLVSLLLASAACGGSKKPAESPAEMPSPDTTLNGSESSPDGGEAAESTEANSASDAGTAAAAAAPASDSAPAESPAHPTPTVTGSIDGKPFAPKMARVTRPMQKDGRIVVSLDERTDCGGGDLKAGEAALTMLVPWEDGYKVDVGSLRGAKKKGGDIAFIRVGAGGKKESAAAFKPTGRVTIVRAPMEENSTGKLSIDLQSGDYMLSGDLDIQVCVAPKSAKPAKAGKATKGKKK